MKILMRKTTHAERADEMVPMNKFLRVIRIFIVVSVLGFIAFGIIVWIVVGVVDSNRESIKDQKEQSAQLHQERLDEDANLQHQISDAVCTFVDPIPAGTPKIDELRSKYGCTTPSASPSATSTPTPTPTPTHSLSVGPTVSKSGVGPTSTITVTPSTPVSTPAVTPPAIINLPKLICLPSGVCL